MREGRPNKCRFSLMAIAVLAFAESGCGALGQYTSMAMGGDGLGLISYQDTPSDLLKVAHCEDVPCTSATVSVLDSGGGRGTAVAIGRDHLGLIGYRHDGDAGVELRVAHCVDTPCTAATTSTIDRGGLLESPALAIGQDGLGLLAYWDYLEHGLKIAHCENAACETVTVTVLDHIGTVDGNRASIAIGSDGLALVAYHAEYSGQLKMAHCENTACTVATLSTIDSGTGPGIDVGNYPSVAVGRDGVGLVSSTDGYVGRTLRVAHCGNVPCTGADALSAVDVDPAGRVLGQHTSLAIGPDGLGLVSYEGPQQGASSGTLRVAHCEDVACRRASVSTVDRSPFAGKYTSLAIGADGLGLISYHDQDSQSSFAGLLKVAHCLDLGCTQATVSVLDRGSR